MSKKSFWIPRTGWKKTLTQALRHRITPAAIDLTHRRCISRQQHARMTTIDNTRTQTGSRLDILQPTVVQRTRMTAIDLFAGRQRTAPLPIRSAASRRFPNQCVTVTAFVADHRIVRDAGVDGFAILRILWRWALNGMDVCFVFFLRRKLDTNSIRFNCFVRFARFCRQMQ